jgi:hypothetical protein
VIVWTGGLLYVIGCSIDSSILWGVMNLFVSKRHGSSSVRIYMQQLLIGNRKYNSAVFGCEL